MPLDMAVALFAASGLSLGCFLTVLWRMTFGRAWKGTKNA